MKRSTSTLFAGALLLAAASASQAALTFTGSAINENFDSLPSTGTTTGLFATGVVTPIPGTSGFDGAKIAGSGTTGMNFVANDGSANSGALYSFGTVDSTERALGAIASGTNIAAFGVQIVNNGASEITSVTIGFDREQFRSSTSTKNILPFAYAVSGGTVTAANYLTSTDLIANTALDLVGDDAVAANGILTPPTVVAVSSTFAVSIPVGQSLFLRFTDTNDVGNDAALAIDNFSFSAVAGAPIPEPAALGLLPLAGMLLGGRRRR